MNPAIRAQMIDVEVVQPVNGARVFALGLGGMIAQIVWNRCSSQFFVAWMDYPETPQSVKDRVTRMRESKQVNAVKSAEETQ